MATLEALLADPAATGLYRLAGSSPIGALRRRVEGAGRRCFALDGAAIVDKASFLRSCASVLAFPSYFGRNWDALEECLTDPDWAPAGGAVAIYAPVAPFASAAPADWAVAREVLASAVARWRGTPTPLTVLLGGPEKLLPGLPALRV